MYVCKYRSVCLYAALEGELYTDFLRTCNNHINYVDHYRCTQTTAYFVHQRVSEAVGRALAEEERGWVLSVLFRFKNP